MTTWTNNPRTLSLADNTVATSANNASPDALTLQVSGSGVVTFRTPGYWQCASPTTGVARFDKTINTTSAAMVVMFDLTSTAPDATLVSGLVRLFQSAGQSGSGLAVSLSTTGTLIVSNILGVTLYTTPTVVTGKRVRIFLGAAVGTTTTNGTINFACYIDTAADGTTPTHTYNSSAVNTGTTNIATQRLGNLITGTSHTINVEYAMGSDSQSTETGLNPLNVNAAPIANAGSDQTGVEPWSLVTLTGIDSDTDGTVVNRVWSQTAGSPTVSFLSNGATATFEASGTIAGTTQTFTYTVTDDDGAVGTDPMTVTTLPVTERAVIGGVMVPMRIRPASSTFALLAENSDTMTTEGGDTITTA